MADAAYTVECRSEALVEARVSSLSTPDHVDAYGRAIAALAVASRSTPVLCADHRPVRIYPPVVTDHLVDAFRPNNGRFARIAILVSPTNATLAMQLRRMARDAGFEDRKVFTDAASAVEHLTPALDGAGAARLRAFLDELG